MENITNKTPVNILDAIRNGTAFEAIQPFQEPSWLMRDFAYQAQIIQIQGQSGGTWIGCELAKSIAEGSRFVSRYECTAPCGVVYIQGGMTDSHIRERISRLSTLENRASINIISPEKTFNDEPPNLCDETFQDEFSAALSTNTYGAAIFDTVGCFMPEKPEPSQIIRLIITAGKCELLLKRVERAEAFFEKAVKLNPRVNIQKQLGWIYLERQRFPEAISMLHDHLQREAADYEAYNLLVKAFYETGRYEGAIDLIEIILKDYRDNNCFENNLFLCHILFGTPSESLPFLRDKENPFLTYNWKVYREKPAAWDKENGRPLKSKLIFQDFRHGNNRKRKQNTITIEQEDGGRLEFRDPIICLGRNSGNDLVSSEMSVSRRHCVIINYPEDVWLHDLGSTHGTYVDGQPVEQSIFVDRRCRLSIGNSELTVLPKEGILL